jgi:hypothetical protein
LFTNLIIIAISIIEKRLNIILLLENHPEESQTVVIEKPLFHKLAIRVHWLSDCFKATISFPRNFIVMARILDEI